MSKNEYMEQLKKRYAPEHATYEVLRDMALIKELQTLNDTLKELLNEDYSFRFGIDRGKLGADGT